MKVSIIIPSWNREEDLRKCLESIKKQGFKDYEVIIVDNNSEDDTKEMIKSKFPEFKIIALRRNVGAAKARNIGIKKASGEYVWFLDSDAYLTKNNCLKNMVNILKSDSSIGQLGGEIIDGKIRIPHSYRNQDGLFEFVDKCRMREVESINTSNCIMKKELILKIGGFDPVYFYGYEDNEVSFKVKKRGYKCIVDDRVVAVHNRTNLSRVSTFYLWHRNRIRFIILKEDNPFFLFFLPLEPK